MQKDERNQNSLVGREESQGVKSTAFQDRNNKNFTTFLKNPIAELEKTQLLFSNYQKK